MATIEVDKQRVAAFCRRNRIRRLAFFGSVLREDFGPNSEVDLNTLRFLSRHFRDTVLAKAEDQYAA